ncbi:putative leucine-rich repeat domain superfamily [Septoria linicola]|nr:putative leucine-rich repeat domain superfamily [Septoria linicola]
MAATAQSLPVDLYHLLSTELADRLDFPTLYNCVTSSAQIANSGAIAALYRISHSAPVKGGGEGLSLAEQELTVQRWSILWRSIILSAFGKTLHPYCRHLRLLDLRDLADLLDDDKFRNKITKNFFAGELSQFHHVSTATRGRPARLDIKRIVTAIGDKITQSSPLLDALTEPTNSSMLSSQLVNWAPRLTHLKSLDLWDGAALADEAVQNALHQHCPNLSVLRLYSSRNDDADRAIATFISGMQQNTLTYFENLSICHIGTETCLALNHHGKSLQSLKLFLTGDDVPALALLQGCTSIMDLSLTSPTGVPDLKATQNDIYLEIIEWLQKCISLREISFMNFTSAPDLLLPVLLNKDVRLQKLQINANDTNANDTGMYVVNNHREFHQALTQQPDLTRLLLRADPDPATRDDIDTLIDSFVSLKALRELGLWRISDYFTDAHIGMLAQQLPKLEELYVGGYGISDSCFNDLAQLKNLRVLTLSGVTTFTEKGIMDFVNQLGTGNRGLVLAVDNADYDSALSQESQEIIRAAIMTKLDGRFEYQLLRDPNYPDLDSDDSD